MHAEFGREREELALAVAFGRAERHLERAEASGTERARLRLAEGRRVVVCDAEPVDHASLALLLEPRQVLLPRDEVVDLLDLDPPEPVDLVGQRRRPRRATWSRSSTPGSRLTETVERRAPSDRSAPRYIGDESKSRTPAACAEETTAPAVSTSRSKVFQVPSPTTGPAGSSHVEGYQPGSPPARRFWPATRPRGFVDQRQRDVDHPLEVGDGDPLGRRVDVDHPVREVDAREAALVEHVGVSGAAGRPNVGS